MTDKIIEIIVGSWRSGRKYMCHSCKKAKVTAENPTCSKCGQEHQVIVEMGV